MRRRAERTVTPESSPEPSQWKVAGPLPGSLRWKVAALITLACCAVAAVVGVLVHRTTLERTMRLGEARALMEAATVADQYRAGTAPEPPTPWTDWIKDPADLPTALRARLPTESPTESPAELPAELPAEPRTESSIASPAASPTERPATSSADSPDGSSAESPTGSPAWMPDGSAVTWYDDQKPDQPWMWAAQRVRGGFVATSKIDMSSDLASLRALDRAMVLAALTALAVVVPLSALLAEPANRRLRRVADTARRIAAGDLDARVATAKQDKPERRNGIAAQRDPGHPDEITAQRDPAHQHEITVTRDPDRQGGIAAKKGRGRRDEIADIAVAVDSMAASLQHRLLAEQRFTADVAHDLRTPLMGLVAAVELLEEGEATELVRDRVRLLRSLVEDLLEVSRLDAGAEVADRVRVPLAELARQSAARVGVEARVQTPDGGEPVAETDPRRLDRIVANLVLNARRHGEPPVLITVRDHLVEIRDHGPGYPPELLAEGPRRFRTGAAERGRGHGLGLTIALGQAGVIGAELTLANAEEGGALATLRLPRRDRDVLIQG
ncbi:sensor histidine kinase [Nonomuraea fuscirosea]|uniref:sensor histidine kinase n=1 Tax=Nonomuraea fuscirosea TaxID=1291556 RepID=UPI0034328C72